MSNRYTKIQAFRTCNNKDTFIYENEKEVQARIIGSDLGRFIWTSSLGAPKDDESLYDWLIETLVRCSKEKGMNEMRSIMNQFNAEVNTK
jgi:hypothetical protein